MSEDVGDQEIPPSPPKVLQGGGFQRGVGLRLEAETEDGAGEECSRGEDELQEDVDEHAIDGVQHPGVDL